MPAATAAASQRRAPSATASSSSDQLRVERRPGAAAPSRRLPTPSRRSRTSCASRIGAAPSAIRSLVPSRHLERDPARDRADLAAELERLVGGDQRARRLRGLDHHGHRPERGHDPVALREAAEAPGRRPGGASETTAPGEDDPLVQPALASRDRRRPARCRARRSWIPPPASAPRCAAASIPRAIPLTTTSPAPASSWPSSSATSSPYELGRREPTIVTAVVRSDPATSARVADTRSSRRAHRSPRSSSGAG